MLLIILLLFLCMCSASHSGRRWRLRWESWRLSTRFNFCFRRYNHLSPLGLQVQRLWFEGRGGVRSRGAGAESKGGRCRGSGGHNKDFSWGRALELKAAATTGHDEPMKPWTIEVRMLFSPHAELNAMSANQFSCESAGFEKNKLRNNLPH